MSQARSRLALWALPNYTVDHIDIDKSNNKQANLRWGITLSHLECALHILGVCY